MECPVSAPSSSRLGLTSSTGTARIVDDAILGWQTNGLPGATNALLARYFVYVTELGALSTCPSSLPDAVRTRLLALGDQRISKNGVIIIKAQEHRSLEKNRAMRAHGAELIEHGRDFAEALDFAAELAGKRGLHFVPSFDERLVRGVATYGLEFLRGAPALDRVYVPIGLGSGICGLAMARAALGLEATTEIVGVVAERAPTYADSFAAGRPVPSETIPDTIADGVACRVPNAEALTTILAEAARIVRVSEADIRAAMRHYFTDCHQVAEGAGAAPLAAALLPGERERNRGARLGLVLSGGNVDATLYREILAA